MRWIEGPDGVWRPERPDATAPGEQWRAGLPAWLPVAIAVAVAVVTALVRSGR